MKEKKEISTLARLAYWVKKLDKYNIALAMAFEDYKESHANVIKILGVYIGEKEQEIKELKEKKGKKGSKK